MKNLVGIVSNFLNDNKNWHVYLLKNWISIIGQLKDKIRLELIQNDLIVIGVYESHWMQELFMLSKHIQKKVNDALGENKIKAIRFRLVEKQIFKNKYILEKKNHQKFVYAHNKKNIILKKIQDETLRDCLLSYFNRCANNAQN